MSSYVEKVLQPSETVAFRGTIHWFVYLPAVFFILFAAAGAVLLAATATDSDKDIAYALIAFGVLFGVPNFLRAWFKRFTTEIAVTDRRVIFKHGFVRRQTVEMNMSKVESVDVDQSILGRMFDYGDITVRGTGGGLEPLHMIANPLAFRNAVIAR